MILFISTEYNKQYNGGILVRWRRWKYLRDLRGYIFYYIRRCYRSLHIPHTGLLISLMVNKSAFVLLSWHCLNCQNSRREYNYGRNWSLSKV